VTGMRSTKCSPHSGMHPVPGTVRVIDPGVAVDGAVTTGVPLLSSVETPAREPLGGPSRDSTEVNGAMLATAASEPIARVTGAAVMVGGGAVS
jgi:hypothetical protein